MIIKAWVRTAVIFFKDPLQSRLQKSSESLISWSNAKIFHLCYHSYIRYFTAPSETNTGTSHRWDDWQTTSSSWLSFSLSLSQLLPLIQPHIPQSHHWAELLLLTLLPFPPPKQEDSDRIKDDKQRGDTGHENTKITQLHIPSSRPFAQCKGNRWWKEVMRSQWLQWKNKQTKQLLLSSGPLEKKKKKQQPTLPHIEAPSTPAHKTRPRTSPVNKIPEQRRDQAMCTLVV